jgi:ribosome-associated protein
LLAADTLASVQLAARAAMDKKAFHVVGFDVAALTSFTDSFLICSAASDRQVAAIVDEVQRQLGASGRRPLHVEGEARADWVLLDYGDFIVHVFTEEKRSYYALDSLWGDATRLDGPQLGVAVQDDPDSR